MTQNRNTGYGVGSPQIHLAPPPISVQRAPTTLDTDFDIGQLWLDLSTNIAYTYFGRGVWAISTGSTGEVLTLSDTANVTAFPNALGNIQISGGAGVTTTTGSNVIVISASGTSFNWQAVTTAAPANPIQLVKENGYVCTGGGTVTFNTPPIAAIGDVYIVVGTATEWTVSVSPGQRIFIGSSSTTTNAGFISSMTTGDVVHLICTTANTTFNALATVGNLDIMN